MSVERTDLTVFMFTDIEGSTNLWEKFPLAMKQNIVVHDALVDSSIEQHGGMVIDHAGDGVFAVFEGGQPLACALDIQQGIQNTEWLEIGELRIRMGLHAGSALKRGDDYRGPLVNRTARIMSTGWGGQILVTPEVVAATALPEGAEITELGAHVLKDLSDPQPIWGMLHPSLSLQDFPALRSLSARPNNLPQQPNELVGREEELALIAENLNHPNCRLVTLLGPGGIGKTRLSIQAGAEAIDRFDHGVFFVYLAPLSSPELAVATMAAALKFTFYSREDPKVQLFQYLKGKRMLLVIDNMEHLMEVAHLLKELIQAAPDIKILVTSRERLNLAEESILEIHGMKLPPEGEVDLAALEQYAAVRLFLDRARQVDAGFGLTDENARPLVKICRLVSGLPLGIELAAAWVRMLPCSEILAEIEKELDFLTSNSQDRPDRHQSLRAVFEYSWNLMTDQEREQFAKLSIFRGTWSREAAQAVAGASLMALMGLMDKSLVSKTATDRFFVHEQLRYYAKQKLTEDAAAFEAVADAHCEYYADFAADMARESAGDRQGEVLERLQNNYENLRDSWRRAIQKPNAGALDRSMDCLFIFFEKRSRFREGLAVLEWTLDQLISSNGAFRSSLLSKLKARKAYFGYRMGHMEEAAALFEQSLVQAIEDEDQNEMAFCQNYLGTLALIKGDLDLAEQRLKDSLALREAAGDTHGVVASLSNLGTVAVYRGQLEDARSCYQDSLDKARAAHDPWSEASLMMNLGEIKRRLGDFGAAQSLFEESLRIRESLGDQWGIAATQSNLGAVFHQLGTYDKATELYRQSLNIRQNLGDRAGIAISLSNLGSLARVQGQTTEAHALLSESLELRRELGDRLGESSSLCELGYIALDADDRSLAIEHFRSALRIAQSLTATAVVLDGLIGFARVDIADGHTDTALELLGLALDHPQGTSNVRDRAERTLGANKINPDDEHVQALLSRGSELGLEAALERTLAQYA